MDQVTTLMDTRLAGSKRYPDDKILTKTMINNYTIYPDVRDMVTQTFDYTSSVFEKQHIKYMDQKIIGCQH